MLDYTGVTGTPGEFRTHTCAGFKAAASALGYGSDVKMVPKAGVAPALDRF